MSHPTPAEIDAAYERTVGQATDYGIRIGTVLALVDEVVASTEDRQLAKVDGRTHSDYCHHWHADCLAARIGRTLTGEDTDR